MTLLYIIIGLFGIGALIGLYLLTLTLRKKDTPKAVALIHGIFVAVALVMLIIYTSTNPSTPVESIVIFLIAALGGLVLIYRDLTGKALPKWLAVSHGLVAVCGFIFLLIFVFNN